MTDLLPCPFCGGKPTRYAKNPEARIGQVICENDECFGPRTPIAHQADADGMWNRRITVAAQPIPGRGNPEWFCHWLKGYLGAITGRDELDAFEANSIRNTLNEVIGAQPPAAPVEKSGVMQAAEKAAHVVEGWSASKREYADRVTGSHNGCSAGTGDETGWLIEKDDPQVYCILSADYDEHWTTDANKALRFARREDAQAYSDHIGWTSPPVRVVEHAWPALEPMPRGGMKVDWWEQSVLYRRRLRALMKLVEKEGYSVSSDGRNGMPMALVRTGDEPQAVAVLHALQSTRACLEWLDGRGGLGLDVHAHIRTVLADTASAVTRPHL